MKPAKLNPQQNLRVLKKAEIALSVFSGVLLSLPFLNGKCWVFAWIGFIPLFFAVRDKTVFRTFLLFYLAGIIFWIGTIYWLIHVTLLGEALLILYLAAYFGIFGIFYALSFKLQAAGYRRQAIFGLSSAWVVLEYLRGHLLTGFGWALLGYSQYLNLPLIQIADVTGVYGVSFALMMANLTIASFWGYGIRRDTGYDGIRNMGCGLKRKEILVPVILLFLSLVYGFFQLSRNPLPVTRNPLRISLIQGNIPQELKWAPGAESLILERYGQLTQEAAYGETDLIVWPEASFPGFLGRDDWVFDGIYGLARKTGIPLLVGSVVREREKYFNSALLIDSGGRVRGRYDKLHLVPFGEYIPLKNLLPFLETIVPIGDFSPGKEFTLFTLAYPVSRIPYPPESVHFSVLICFEDTIPELSRSFTRRGAELLINITNDGWYKRTCAAYQHLAASVFRAVENRIPLVRAANTGVSCFIDSKGRVSSRVEEENKDIFIQGFKTQSVILRQGGSLYQRIGDLFVLGCFAQIVFCGIINRKMGNMG